jgi:hypothetical protein
VFEELKTDWRIIRDNPPGQRFQARYWYRKIDSPLPPAKRILKITIGVTLLPVGVILWFIPGPGWLTIFLGLALLAGESKQLSRFLDEVEVRLRKIIRRLRHRRPGD